MPSLFRVIETGDVSFGVALDFGVLGCGFVEACFALIVCEQRSWVLLGENLVYFWSLLLLELDLRSFKVPVVPFICFSKF